MLQHMRVQDCHWVIIQSDSDCIGITTFPNTNICRTRLSVGEAWMDSKIWSNIRDLDNEYDESEPIVDTDTRCSIQ
jgi:hypothetical protein